MTLNSSGIICDVCGKYILLSDYEAFTCQGIKSTLHCHIPDCKKAIKVCGENWTQLPDGPLRKAFENYHKEQDNAKAK